MLVSICVFPGTDLHFFLWVSGGMKQSITHTLYKILAQTDTKLPEHEKEIYIEQVQTGKAAKGSARYDKVSP